ncbi:MAG: metallophosphoesterase, partial [Prevotella sp.]
MIARIVVWVILLIVLPDVYLYVHVVRHRIRPLRWWITLLWWTTSVGMIAYTVGLSCVKSFIPDNFAWIEVYLFLAVILINPKAIFTVCSLVGSVWCHFRHTSINRGNRVGVILAGLSVLVSVYGLTVGPRKLHVTHVNLYFKDLPSEFEGYKIVQFSDAHVGTFNYLMDGILVHDVDSIIAQKADLICFTGDLVDV